MGLLIAEDNTEKCVRLLVETNEQFLQELGDTIIRDIKQATAPPTTRGEVPSNPPLRNPPGTPPWPERPATGATKETARSEVIGPNIIRLTFGGAFRFLEWGTAVRGAAGHQSFWEGDDSQASGEPYIIPRFKTEGTREREVQVVTRYESKLVPDRKNGGFKVVTKAVKAKVPIAYSNTGKGFRVENHPGMAPRPVIRPAIYRHAFDNPNDIIKKMLRVKAQRLGIAGKRRP